MRVRSTKIISFKMNELRQNLRSIVIIGSVIGGIAVASYPIIIAPYLNPNPWSKQPTSHVTLLNY